MAKEYKLDIFDVLNAIDRRDGAFLGRQDEDAKKAFAPRVVLRWAGSVRGREAAAYMTYMNEVVNVQFDDLNDHPELQFRLMAVCGAGSRQQHDWIPMTKIGKAAPKINAFLLRFWPLASASEIDLLLSKFDSTSFEEFVNGSGCSPEEAKSLIDAFNKKSGEPEVKKPRSRKPKA